MPLEVVYFDISGSREPAIAASSRTIIKMSWCQEGCAVAGGVQRAGKAHKARSTGVSAATACVWSSSHTWPVLAARGARSSQRTTHTLLTAALGASPARSPGFTTRRSQCLPKPARQQQPARRHRRCYRVNQADPTCRWAGWAAGIGQRRSETGNFELRHYTSSCAGGLLRVWRRSFTPQQTFDKGNRRSAAHALP